MNKTWNVKDCKITAKPYKDDTASYEFTFEGPPKKDGTGTLDKKTQIRYSGNIVTLLQEVAAAHHLTPTHSIRPGDDRETVSFTIRDANSPPGGMPRAEAGEFEAKVVECMDDIQVIANSNKDLGMSGGLRDALEGLKPKSPGAYTEKTAKNASHLSLSNPPNAQDALYICIAKSLNKRGIPEKSINGATMRLMGNLIEARLVNLPSGREPVLAG